MGVTAADSVLSCDGFLGGRLKILQPRRGYRAGIDPVLLAASVEAQTGQSVLELGCGVGTALLCLGARVEGLDMSAVEVQPDYAELARRNAAANGIAIEVHDGDLRAMPGALALRQFDHVLANPPYHDRPTRTPARDQGRETSVAGTLNMSQWIDAGVRRLRPGGRLWLIQRIEQLDSVIAALDDRLGAVTVVPLAPRAGRDPSLFLMQATKGSRGRFRLRAPIRLHDGQCHGDDDDAYSAQIDAALRRACPLRIWD